MVPRRLLGLTQITCFAAILAGTAALLVSSCSGNAHPRADATPTPSASDTGTDTSDTGQADVAPEAAAPGARETQDGGRPDGSDGNTMVDVDGDLGIDATVDGNGEQEASPPADGGTSHEGGTNETGSIDATEPPYRSGSCSIDSKYTRSVSMDDTTLGHSARDVAKAFAANGSGVLQWFDGSETLIRITADISQATVTIDDSPPYRGYCTRFMNLKNVTFTISSADGRLQEVVVSELVANDAGGPVLAIWPQLGMDLDEIHGSLHVPDTWKLPEQNFRHIAFVVNSKANLESPYCLVGEARDEKPTSDCTAWSGKIIYAGMRQSWDQFDFYVTELVGKWTWQ